MSRDDDAGRARSLGAPDHRAEVARVGDLVEAGEQRPLDGCELVRIGVAIRLAPGEHALVVARLGRLADLAIGLDVDARAVLSQGSELSARSVAQTSSTSRGPRIASRTGLRP